MWPVFRGAIFVRLHPRIEILVAIRAEAIAQKWVDSFNCFGKRSQTFEALILGVDIELAWI